MPSEPLSRERIAQTLDALRAAERAGWTATAHAHAEALMLLVDELLDALSAERNRRAQPADDSSLRCSCEWAHAATGDVDTDWPAELDPHCAVHADAQPAERPQRIERECGCVFWLVGNEPDEYGPTLAVESMACPDHSADADDVAATHPEWPRIAGAYLTDAPEEG